MGLLAFMDEYMVEDQCDEEPRLEFKGRDGRYPVSDLDCLVRYYSQARSEEIRSERRWFRTWPAKLAAALHAAGRFSRELLHYAREFFSVPLRQPRLEEMVIWTGMVLLTEICLLLLLFRSGGYVIQTGFPSLPVGPWYCFLLLGPVLEEFLYRGPLLIMHRRLGDRVLPAFIILGLIYGAGHIVLGGNCQVTFLLFASLTGFNLGWLVLKTRTVLCPCVVHILVNCFIWLGDANWLL